MDKREMCVGGGVGSIGLEYNKTNGSLCHILQQEKRADFFHPLPPIL